MKLIATVTLVTKAGHEVAPGSVVEVKDADEAQRLITLGFADVPAPAPAAADKPEGEGAAS